MTSQPPLLDGTDASLPGPQFTPRPGWGGRLSNWFSHNTYTVVFRIVLVVALVLIVRSLWANLPARQESLTPTPSGTPQTPDELTVTANPGDGMTNLAARAIDVYVAVQTRIIRLDSAQHLFAVDTLARSVCWCPLEVGQSVSFSNAAISAVVKSAQSLTPLQHAAWARLLR